jgi:hypothetical protein
MTISRRPKRWPSTENAPGPNRAIATAVISRKRAARGRVIEATAGAGSQEREIPRMQRPMSRLANGVIKPTIKESPARRSATATSQTKGVRAARPDRSNAPNDTAMPPSATRKRSNPRPGRPLGNVENNLCSASLRPENGRTVTETISVRTCAASPNGVTCKYHFWGVGTKGFRAG